MTPETIAEGLRLSAAVKNNDLPGVPDIDFADWIDRNIDDLLAAAKECEALKHERDALKAEVSRITDLWFECEGISGRGLLEPTIRNVDAWIAAVRRKALEEAAKEIDDGDNEYHGKPMGYGDMLRQMAEREVKP